ncbi:MAG: pirin family protein [Robiginitalea sp.]|uniref:pirin family protein n=1 Tax=Robiginitalea sp. TaxID=1902411 RepID=UPI003C74E65C
MSHSGMIIPERSRDIGDFLVGRLLPFRKKRMIGPFIFIDHMGPVTLGPGRYLDVGQHPHIGLATLTYLLEGTIEHRDGLGTRQRIMPGSVNLMVAGRGITHTERTPEPMRNGSVFTLHGYQIWIALPKQQETMEPAFFHAEAADLPRWKTQDASYNLICGKAFGKESPVPHYSELFLMKVKTGGKVDLNLAEGVQGEIGIIVVSGTVRACGNEIPVGSILYSKHGETCTISCDAKTHLMVFGGEPLPEERFIHWNFVSSERPKIEAALQAWNRKTFVMIDGEKSYIPLPESKSPLKN